MAEFGNTIIYGYLHVHESVIFNSNLNVVGTITAKSISLTQTNNGATDFISTPPISVISKGLVENLNVDYLDNQHGAYYLALENATGYLANKNINYNTITLNKLEYINNARLLGRPVSTDTTTKASVLAMTKTEAKPILDLVGTNRGDQAVFNKITIIDNSGTTTTGPAAVAPVSYDELKDPSSPYYNASATLTTLVANKETLTFKTGNLVTYTPIGSPENTLKLTVGLKLNNNILLGSISNTEPVGTYSPYTARQTYLSLDTSTDSPYLLTRLNINAAIHASNIYVSDLVLQNGTSNYISNSNKFTEVLTTKKDDTAINETYTFALFAPETTNKYGYDVGHNIVKTIVNLDDSRYTTNNILTAKKVQDDFVTFRINYVDSRIYGAVNNIESLLALNVGSLEDGMLILVKDEGIYRLSKIEDTYATVNGKYIISPGNDNYPYARWIKVSDNIAYHNTTGDIQGGKNGEYYHLTAAQHTQLHDMKSDNQYISSGKGMNFSGGNSDVTITLGEPSIINSKTINNVSNTSHTHTIESYNLTAATPIHITEGAMILGSDAIIRIDAATTYRQGVVSLSNKYNGTSEFNATTEKALTDGLASVVSHPNKLVEGSTTIGYVPVWANTIGTQINSGYLVETDYDTFKQKVLADLNGSLVRADIVRKYIDNLIEDQDVFAYKGPIDCSTNPPYPAANKGHIYVISVAGKIGGESGAVVEAGDMLICKTDNAPVGTQAETGTNWDIIQTNINGAVTNTNASVNNNFAIFDGTSGKVIKDSGYNYNTFQPYDLDLTAISALSGTGIAIRTADNTWANKEITTANVGSTQGITITNGNGTATGNIIIQHADTSTQLSLTGATSTTWINSISLDDYGHVTKLTTTVHPTTTAKSVEFAANNLTTDTTSGITVIDTLNISNDTNMHVTALNYTSRYLPVATKTINGILTSTDWDKFNNKVNGPTTTTLGHVPTWNNITGNLLTDGYAVENTSLTTSTINNNTLVTTNLLNNYTINRINYKGNLDCSANPAYFAGISGDMYIVSVAGKIGGTSGTNMYVGDILLCLANDTTGTSSNWTIYHKNKKQFKKIITVTSDTTTIDISSIIDGTSPFSTTIYRNGVYQIENIDSGDNAYDYSISGTIITLTRTAISGEKIAILVEEF